MRHCTAFVCFLLHISSLCWSCDAQAFGDEEVQCEDVSIPLCAAILPYNYTTFPNLLNHRRPQDAEADFALFLPLLAYKCSDLIAFFLCNMYSPYCDQQSNRVLPPCREICEQSRYECEATMEALNFGWPSVLNCENLPRFGQGQVDPDSLCVGANDTSLVASSVDLGRYLKDIDLSRLPGGRINISGVLQPRRPGTLQEQPDLDSCPALLTVRKGNDTVDGYSFGGFASCGIPCPPLADALPDDWFFTKHQRDVVAPRWILGWSVVCLIATFLTLSTFLVDRQRFKYPERPIVFLSVSYFIVALIYVAGYASLNTGGDSVIACNGEYGFLYQQMSGNSVGCAIQFLVLYFFTIAAAMWWVILTLTWFLAAGLAWSTEAIDSISQYFHLVSWVVPAVLTIVILAMQKVDGDYLSGVCFVGVQDLRSHNIFVLGPLLVFLLLGTFFLLAGFYSMFRIRSVMKHRVSHAEKSRLERFMIRIGIFSILYSVPAAIVVACLIYESANRNEWQRTQVNCAHHPDLNSGCAGLKPSFNVFMIKYFMQVFVGITSGFWICSRKTFYSWQSAVQRVRNRRQREKRSSGGALHPAAYHAHNVAPVSDPPGVPIAEVSPMEARQESNV